MSVEALTSAMLEGDGYAAPHLNHASSGCRINTRIARWDAVEQVIRTMHERLDEPLSLQDMADVALLSPYHLNRVFRHITGIPPGKFLAALRIEAAKRLLLTTDLSVAEICYEVGYNSQGTFTTLFTQLVGVSPRHLRRIAEDTYLDEMVSIYNYDEHPPDRYAREPAFVGHINATHMVHGPIFVGLFPTPMPQGRPVACTCTTMLGYYTIPEVPDGRYYAFAAAYDQSDSPLTYLLPDQGTLHVGRVEDPIVVQHGQARGSLDLTLRSPRLVDPPILMALPAIIPQHTLMHNSVAA